MCSCVSPPSRPTESTSSTEKERGQGTPARTRSWWFGWNPSQVSTGDNRRGGDTGHVRLMHCGAPGPGAGRCVGPHCTSVRCLLGSLAGNGLSPVQPASPDGGGPEPRGPQLLPWHRPRDGTQRSANIGHLESLACSVFSSQACGPLSGLTY